MLIRSWHPSPSPPSPARRWLCTVYAQRTTTRPPETAIRLPVARNFLPWVRAFPRPPSQESLRFASPSVVQTLETWKVVGYQVLLNSSHVLNFFLSIVEILGRIKSRKNLLPRFDNSSKLWNRRANERKNEKFLSFVSPPFATGSPPPSVDSWHRFDSASRSAIVRTRASVLPRHCYLDRASSSPFLCPIPRGVSSSSLFRRPPRFAASFPRRVSGTITNVFNILFSFVRINKGVRPRVSINYPLDLSILFK